MPPALKVDFYTASVKMSNSVSQTFDVTVMMFLKNATHNK
jgi:hypothetical protein